MSYIFFRPLRLSLAVGILFLSTACSPAEDTPVSEPPVAVSAPATKAHAQPGARQTDLQQAIGAARQDLARRRGIEEDSIEVREAATLSWRSGAIGCPEPGVYYTQALVPGYRIVLQVGSEAITYHGRQGGAPFLCPPDRAETPVR